MSEFKKRRYILILLGMTLLAKGALSLSGSDWKTTVPSVNLNRIPTTILSWDSTDIKLDSNAYKMLSPDAYIWRSYLSDREPPVDFLVIFGHSKNTFHSPGFCLPGSGWQVIRKESILFDYGDGRLPMTLFEIQKGEQRRLVLFSFLAGNQGTTSLIQHNWNLLVNRVLHRSEGGAMIRMIIPLVGTEKHTLESGKRFAKIALPALYKELSRKTTNPKS